MRKITRDLLVMLLYRLLSNFENFHSAIESRDVLPKPGALRIKIVKESGRLTNKATTLMLSWLILFKRILCGIIRITHKRELKKV